MATNDNFIKGKDLVSDPTGDTILALHSFVSKSGDNLNVGDNVNPYLTIVYALDDNLNTETIVVGSGIYKERIANRPARLTGDINTEIVAPDTLNTPFQSGGNRCFMVNLKFSQWVTCLSVVSDRIGIEDCLFIDGINSLRFNGGGGESANFVRNKFVGGIQNLTFQWLNNVVNFRNNMFLNSEVNFTDNVGTISNTIKNCLFYNNSTLDFDSVELARNTEYCCFYNSPITVNGTTYPNLAAAKLVDPLFFPNCIESDPLFIGDPNDGEFIVAANSPLLFSGILSTDIGFAKTGINANSTTDFGTNPDTNNDTVYVAGPNGVFLEVNPPALSGNRIDQPQDLGRIYDSPLADYTGTSDYLNNAPTKEPLSARDNPRGLIFYAKVSPTLAGIAGAPLEKYVWGYPMWKDTNGVTIGNPTFEPGNLAVNRFRYIQIDFGVTNEYIPA